MKKKKCIAAGALAAFLLCESLFTPNLAGMGAGLLKVQAAAANVALNKEVTSSANESATWSADKAVEKTHPSVLLQLHLLPPDSPEVLPESLQYGNYPYRKV